MDVGGRSQVGFSRVGSRVATERDGGRIAAMMPTTCLGSGSHVQVYWLPSSTGSGWWSAFGRSRWRGSAMRGGDG